MANEWFETVEIARQRAQKRIPKSVYKALVAGSERGSTLDDNMAAYAELGFAPHVAGGFAERDLSVHVLGQTLSMPVMISPTGVQAVHPDGEVAVARAAAARGTAVGLSSFGSKPIEEVTAVNSQVFFQIYWSGSREVIQQRLHRAKEAGAAGIILTLDWSFAYGRDWGSPQIPDRIDLKTMIKNFPEAVTSPRWVWNYAKTLRPPALSVPNMVGKGEKAPTFFEAYGEWMQTPPPSWEDVAWLRSQWDGPFMLKGIMRLDDARRAVDAGVSAISISNHGGNNIDGTPASIRALPVIADAVGDQVELLLDGGIRRGSDAVKAVALGAKAVMLGRAYLWGLAANGQAGVENVLDVMRNGFDSTLLGLGKQSASSLDRSDVLIPEGFMRVLGDK